MQVSQPSCNQAKNSSRFEYLNQTATLVVNGELRIDAQIEPAILAAKISKIYNNGEIFCSREQLGALQFRTVVSQGEFHLPTERKEETCNLGLLRI